VFQIFTNEYLSYLFALVAGLSIGGGLESLSLGISSMQSRYTSRHQSVQFVSILLLVLGTFFVLVGLSLFCVLLFVTLNTDNSYFVLHTISLIAITSLIIIVLVVPIFLVKLRRKI
jgi:heme/copper-type cytochrome/quinol oxidase subunit 2